MPYGANGFAVFALVAAIETSSAAVAGAPQPRACFAAFPDDLP